MAAASRSGAAARLLLLGCPGVRMTSLLGSRVSAWGSLLKSGPAAARTASLWSSATVTGDELKVANLMGDLREHGHLFAKLDPFGRSHFQEWCGRSRETLAAAQLASFCADYPHRESDAVKNEFLADRLHLDQRPAEISMLAVNELISLAWPQQRQRSGLIEAVEHMMAAWCDTLTAEVGHIMEADKRMFLVHQLEMRRQLSYSMRRDLLKGLLRSDTMEAFLGQKFPASKRFGMEGCEALVPGLEIAVARLGTHGVRSVQIGMAHRGRLNVLHNVLGKPLGKICAEMEGSQSSFSVGDVKYHLGTEGEVMDPVQGVKVRVSVAPNPSHLEAVNTVVAGIVRAMQERAGPSGVDKHAAIILHGDASFSGLGVVAEGLQQGKLQSTNIGGTIHLVVNNQIGFTTAPADGRSTMYCTDMAKGLGIPVLHANADDPEAVVRACKLAADWRARYQEDIVVSCTGYRRNGHNELDDPEPTAPLTSKLIREHLPVARLYSQRLQDAGLVTAAEVDAWLAELGGSHQAEYDAYRAGVYNETADEFLTSSWQGAALMAALSPPEAIEEGGTQMVAQEQEPTGLPVQTLQWMGRQLTRLPEGFTPHPAIAKLMGARRGMVESPTARVDMGMAEALAFGCLLCHKMPGELGAGHERDAATGHAADMAEVVEDAGAQEAVRGLNMGTYPIRLTGQDVQRGTFNHRHMVLHDQVTGAQHTPLNHVAHPFTQEHIQVHNSALNEYASLGFEYGFSVGSSDAALTIWEAQFGDFVNNAQVMVDQFITSGEAKWGQQSGLVLSLPHGFEGMGPDHSSARIERFLQLANDDPDHLPGYTPTHRQQIRATFDALCADGKTGQVTLEKVRELLGSLHEEEELKSPQLHEISDTVWRELGLPAGEDITFEQWEAFMVQYMRRHAESHANFFLVNATTPAQLFHVLRRQVNRPFRKPLVLLSHKFLLHHGPCTSALHDFATGTFFNRLIDDGKASDNTRHKSTRPDGTPFLLPPHAIRRVILCSGAFYYKLSQARRSRRIRDIVLVRLEQIAPFPHDLIARCIRQYGNAEIVWCQEEPKNMGAWQYVKPRFQTIRRELEVGPLARGGEARVMKYVGRASSASTATASFAIHKQEMQDLIDAALTADDCVHEY
eukprot:jgi/Tetstr1/461093/TSEL_006236.t1